MHGRGVVFSDPPRGYLGAHRSVRVGYELLRDPGASSTHCHAPHLGGWNSPVRVNPFGGCARGSWGARVACCGDAAHPSVDSRGIGIAFLWSWKTEACWSAAGACGDRRRRELNVTRRSET